MDRKRVTEISDWERKQANSGEVYALFGDFGDEVRPAYGGPSMYCADDRADGHIATVHPVGNTRGVWVCQTCGRITNRVTADSRGRWALSEPGGGLSLNQWVIVRARGFIDGENGKMSLVESPYEARDSIIKLPKETERRWVPGWELWGVRTTHESALLEQARADGFNAISLPAICNAQERVIDSDGEGEQ